MKKHGCVVGLGAVGPIHATALRNEERLYGVCDIVPKRLEGYEQYKIRRYTNVEDVLADSCVDVIHICTPHYLHVPMAIEALNAGKDVVLEKPAAMNPKEFKRLSETARASSQHLCVMMQNRTNPAVRKMREMRWDPAQPMGALTGISGFLTWQRTAEYYDQDAWRGKWATEGGGLLINQAIHLIDLINYLGGPVHKVRSSISTKVLENAIEVEDTADAVFETASGLRTCFYATNCYSESVPMRLELQFEKGLLRYADNRLYHITESTVEVVTTDSGNRPGKSYWGSGHQAVIDGFYSYLETGSGAYITLEDAAPASKTLFALYESARSNKDIIIE